MSELTERQKRILDIVIEEYIKKAIPVSSGFLAEVCDLGICSATVRLDLQELTERGLLEKPYTSGGRVPTDKGYRFFVDNLLEKRRRARKRERELFAKIFKQKNDIWQTAEELARVLAGRCSGLSLVRLGDIQTFWKQGWEDLMEEPEFQDVDYLKEFMGLVADFERNFEDLMAVSADIHIFIGRECPLPEKDFSLMLARPKPKAKTESLFALLGPKRMNFKRNLQTMDGLLEASNLYCSNLIRTSEL